MTIHFKKKQAGLLMLEILAGLIILGSVITGIAMMIKSSGDDTQAAIAAQHLRTVGDAAAAYIRNNYTNIKTITDKPGTPIALITVSELIAARNLPANFSATNNYQQTTCVLVKNDDQVQHPGQVIALAVTEGGTTMNDVEANSIANLVGASGGAYRNNNSGLLQGSRNGWSIPVVDFNNLGNETSTFDPATRPATNNAQCSGAGEGPVNLTAGHPVMALWLANGGINPDVIYRSAIPGRPDLNKMKTPLGLPSMIEGEECKDTTGTTLDPGTIARTDSGDLLTCKDGKWIKASAGGKAILRQSKGIAEKPPTGGPFKYLHANCDTKNGEKLITGTCSAYCHQFVPIGGSPHLVKDDTGAQIAIGWKCVQSDTCSGEAAKVSCTPQTKGSFNEGDGSQAGVGIRIITDEGDIPECRAAGKGPKGCNICEAGSDECTYCPYGSYDGETCDIKCEYKKVVSSIRVREDCKVCNGDRCALCGTGELKSACKAKVETSGLF